MTTTPGNSATTATPASIMNGTADTTDPSMTLDENKSTSLADVEGNNNHNANSSTLSTANGSNNASVTNNSSSTTTVNGTDFTPNNKIAKTASTTSPSVNASTKRIEMDSMMAEFQKNLGQNWDRYRDVITLFLIGKLSRAELQQELDLFLDKNMIKMHNRFLLANYANALRDGPQGENGMLTGWSKKSKDSSRNVKGDGQLAKLKEDIMELSVRERKRIKAIAKESGKKAPIPSTITATRQAMLPKIPFINDKEKLQAQQKVQQNNNVQAPTQSSAQQQQPGTPSQPSTPTSNNNTNTTTTTTSTNNANPIAWTHDIIHAYETPLSSENYELPDQDALTTRMLGISLEHGLLQGVDKQCPEVLQIGLEQYLRDLVQQVVDTVKWRRKPGENTLMAEDVARVLESSATCFVETSGPTYRLNDVILSDEDTLMDDSIPDDMNGGTNTNNNSNNNSGLKNLLNEILTS